MKVEIKRVNGILKVDIDGALYDPLSFKSFRPNKQNVTEFYNAGVRLFSVLSSGVINALGVPYSRFGESWVGDHKYDFSVIDRQMDMFIECAPNGYFAPMFMVDTRPWFLEQNPDIPNSFRHLSQTAHSEKWRKDAGEYLKVVIEHCEKKYGDRIYGYFIMGGMTTEWLAHPDKEASHPIKEMAYKKWLGDENATLPQTEKLERTGDTFLGDDERDVYNARRFHSETVSSTLLYFASIAQSVIKHKKLLGAYFGYLLHLTDSFLYNAGHIDYERVFLSPDIDMISSPSDYHFRKIDDPSGIMVTQKTLDKHNKLYFLEFDHITHVAPTMIYEECDDTGNSYLKEIPGAKDKCKDETESLNLMWRDYIMCNANGSALWWFDMFSGYYDDEELMNEIKKLYQIQQEVQLLPNESVSQVVEFLDEPSNYMLKTKSYYPMVEHQSEALHFCSAPWDARMTFDFFHEDYSDENYKLYYFPVLFAPSNDVIDKIQALRKQGKNMLYCHAPYYAIDDELSVDNMEKYTGITFERVELADNTVRLCFDGASDITYNFTNKTIKGDIWNHKDEEPITPIFSPTNLDVVLGRFEENGKPACGIKFRDDGGFDAFSACAPLPKELIAKIYEYAKIFKYADGGVPVYTSSSFMAVYSANGGKVTLYRPQKTELTDCNTNEKIIADQNGITLEFLPRETRYFKLKV